ncbi:MAG: serine/threonine protein kinase [Burkholderiales bacterium]|nr:serine/threonine protein kinase [Burkholderiales bacterium]
MNRPAGAPDVTIIEFAASERRRTVLVVIGIMLILALALATYAGVKQSLRQLRGTTMQSRLDAELRAFDVWVRQRSNVVERWAQDESVRALVLSLIEAHARAGAAGSGCDAPAAAQLIALLQPALMVRRFVTFDLIDRSGLVIASYEPSHCGMRVSARNFLGHLERTFGGRSSFLRPFFEADRLPAVTKPKHTEPLVWFEAPVLDAQGRAVAALGFAELASAEFASLLRSAAAGESDEVYLFDPSGLLLTESRHADKLARRGLIASPQAPTMLRVHVRDPGENATSAADAVRAVQPLTRLAAHAIAAQDATEPARQRGVLLDAYRNYFGAEVVGAWRWLPRYEMGAALEIETDEAYAPVELLERAFTGVLGLSALALAGIVLALLTNLRLRRGLGRFRRLGRYTLIREIAEGGMASIYLGRHALLKRPIAIKILKRALANEERIARFEREVQLASQLSHPNTIEIYDYGRTRGGDFYYVMEYLDGITLAALVEREGAIGPARSIHLLRQVCAALKEAHARAVVHRDIKPENIMACVRGGEYDVIKILDFGLVKSKSDEVSRDLTSAVKVLGTPAYMAPERFEDAGSVDERADIYALAAVAYLLLAGKRIFAEASGEDLQLRIRHTAVPAPSAVGGVALPATLEALVLRCLAKKPEARPASIVEVMVVLEQLASIHPWSQADAERWWAAYRRAGERTMPQE